MQNQLEKALNLARQTGDTIIIIDKEKANDPFVVMSLNKYQTLTLKTKKDNQRIGGLTEGELIDKINRDIAIWKNEQEIGKDNLGSDFFCFDSINKRKRNNFRFQEEDFEEWEGFENKWDDNDWEFKENDIEDEDENLYYYDESEESKKEEIYDFEDFQKNNEEFGFEKRQDESPEDYGEIKSFGDIAKDRYIGDFEKEDEYVEDFSKNKKSSWKIPTDVKKKAEEVIEN